MSKYTLHKLPERFILTSDEDIKQDDLMFTKNPLPDRPDTAVSKCINYERWLLGDPKAWKKVIAQQDQIDFSELSEEKQKEIGWFDEIQIAESLLKSHPDFEAEGMSDYQNGRFNGIIEGFQKAQELLSDRRFTLKEVNYLIERCQELHPKYWENEIQSLSQKSWKVELEMESFVEEETGDAYKWMNTRPKLTGNKVKILKLLS